MKPEKLHVISKDFLQLLNVHRKARDTVLDVVSSKSQLP